MILVGCEESGVLTRAFLEEGYVAYSCDLKPTRGYTYYHYKADVFDIIPTRRWDLIILHPECTALCVSGNRWYGKGMPQHGERLKTIKYTAAMWELACKYSDRVALENPVGVLFNALDATVFYTCPSDHGDPYTKKTGFATKGLPPLVPTNKVVGDKKYMDNFTKKNRSRNRSVTSRGMAKAIVDQWGPLLCSTK